MRVVQVKISFASLFVIAVVFSPRRWQISPKEKLFFLYVHRQPRQNNDVNHDMQKASLCVSKPYVNFQSTEWKVPD